MPLNCKKCGGPHLTIKCVKDKNNSNKNNSNKDNSNRDNSNRNNSNRNNFNRNNSNRNNFNKNYSSRNNFNRNKYCVRLSNIPTNLTIKELNDLMSEWGDIGKINFNNNIHYKSAYVDFYIKEEAEYFVKALDKTPFDNYIISVELHKN